MALPANVNKRSIVTEGLAVAIWIELLEPT